MKKVINMLSHADSTEGHGVLSAFHEQTKLIKENLNDKYDLTFNKLKSGRINHYHTINPSFFFSLPFVPKKTIKVGYVHLLPETLKTSLNLNKLAMFLFCKYMLWFYKSMDYIVVVNPYFIERLDFYGIDKKVVTYIPNFVDEEKFFVIEDKFSLRKNFDLPTNKFTVICAGQLQTRKGFFDFITCAKRLPEMQFVWAGGFSFGAITDGYEKIKKIVASPPENVKFLGMVPRDQMNELYNLADVMFLASYEELFPMTILESMNCKIPLLLRDLVIYEDILFDFYLRGNDNEEFVSILQKLADDKEYYRNACDLSWKGHNFYSKENVLKMWDDFYEMVQLDPLQRRGKRKQ